jgi:hypothetical protein
MVTIMSAAFWDVEYRSTLRTEAAHSSEISVNIYQSTWRNIP